MRHAPICRTAHGARGVLAAAVPACPLAWILFACETKIVIDHTRHSAHTQVHSDGYLRISLRYTVLCLRRVAFAGAVASAGAGVRVHARVFSCARSCFCSICAAPAPGPGPCPLQLAQMLAAESRRCLLDAAGRC